MSPPDTKERILDAAEALFAEEGFHSTSLRAITGKAGVNLAAVNYHFGSKESLIEAVFERRLRPLNDVRLERLKAVRETARRQKRRPGVEETLLGFIEPSLRFKESGAGSEHFVTLVGRALAEPDETVRDIFLRLMEPVFLLLFETLCEALPERPKGLLFWRLRFALGAMSQAMCSGDKFKKMPPGVEASASAESLIGMLMPFVTAGMEAP